MTAAYVCNICGADNKLGDDPRQICVDCKATVRMRLVMHAFTTGVLEADQPLYRLDRTFEHAGIGLSDWFGYGQRLEKLCAYRNTYYHREPMVDICDPPKHEIGRSDFLIASDVFEHIPPPALSAFQGAAAVLKPGGKFLVSVPMNRRSTQTIEHYPRLNKFAIAQVDGEYVVVNSLADGGIETYLRPRFHGGPGQTLEMRIFSETHVRELLAQAGFSTPISYETDIPEFGLVGLQSVSGVFVSMKGQASQRPFA
jgi:SAM-dependent methyltransferase